MRNFARALTGITMVVLVFLLILLAGANPSVTLTKAEAVEAADQMEVFDALMTAIDRGELASDQYRQIANRNAENYYLVTYTCAVKNRGVLPVEWIRLQLSPQPGDVALLAGAPVDLRAFGGGEVTAVLLTEKGEAGAFGFDAARDLWAEYYVLGSAKSSAAQRQAE